MRLIESCHVDMVPSCSVNPFGSGKDKNEDEQEDFTGLQYFKIPVEILWSHVEYCNHVRYLQYYRYVAVNFWRVELWQILQQLTKFAKVFHYMVDTYNFWFGNYCFKVLSDIILKDTPVSNSMVTSALFIFYSTLALGCVNCL